MNGSNGVRQHAMRLIAVAGIAVAVACPAAMAQAFPGKPVTMVVPLPAGGITDTIARTVAKEMSATWKQPVIVDNRAGASGVIGAGQVARAAKDGYTVLFTITSHVQLPALQRSLPYDALKDFEPVSQVALSSSVLAVAPTFPASNVSELVAKLKAEPEKHSYGSYGVGTTSNIYGELFKRETGVAMAHVPYKGAAPVVNDLLAGVVNIGFVDVGTAIQHIKAGKLKPLAIIGTRRSSQLPEVPTFQELGFKGFEPYAWMGLLAPAGTPRPVIDAMAAEVRRIVRLPDVQARMRDASLEPVGNSPAEFSAVLRTDSETWKRVILASGITLE